MELSSTAYVILGILNWQPRAGYDIKAVVDQSTRFFWAASYSQIYPELKRLERAGLIEGEPAQKGGRRRKVYKVTSAGRRELREWLKRPAEVHELRDEGLLKLFFGSSAPPGRPAGILAEKAAFHRDKLEQLRAIEPHVDKGGYAYLVLRFGIENSEWAVKWCERVERELSREKAAA